MTEEKTGKKRLKVFIDDVKLRHTSHWDQDYMTREEMDKAYAKEKQEADELAKKERDPDAEGKKD